MCPRRYQSAEKVSVAAKSYRRTRPRVTERVTIVTVGT